DQRREEHHVAGQEDPHTELVAVYAGPGLGGDRRVHHVGGGRRVRHRSSLRSVSGGGGRRGGRVAVGRQLHVLRQEVGVAGFRRAELVRSAVHVRRAVPVAVRRG